MEESFEIEEELDPSILGLEPDPRVVPNQAEIVQISEKGQNASESTGDHVAFVQADAPLVHDVPVIPPWTALDLLKSIAGSYASADWVPSNNNKTTQSAYEQYAFFGPTSVRTSSKGSSHSHTDNGSGHHPVARDFAEDAPATTPSPESSVSAKGAEMEKTESYVSTAPSANLNVTTDTTDLAETTNRRPRVLVTWVRTRLPGRRRYRTGIRVHRAPITIPISKETETDEETNLTDNEIASQISIVPERPEPFTQFQRDFANTFGRDNLDKIEHQAKLDSTTGNLAPQIIRDLFPALGDIQSATKIANVIRRQSGLPLLSTTKSDKIALRRALAKMRENLYTEMVAALAIPLAPKSLETDDEEEKDEKKAVTLTPTALTILGNKMPKVFSAEKSLIKAFLANDYEQAYGEKKGRVVWQGGVGRVIGKGEGGFRGTVDTEGLCHVYVDHSNILHGLLHHLYANPSDALPPRHLRTLSLPALSLLLRRGRPTPPGSLHLVASSPLHQNLDSLVRLGWEVSVLKRVELYEDEVEDPTSMKVSARPQARISGHNDIGLRRYREQGVDEILHLKILQVINEKGFSADRGNTLVLATGDARGGQFNRDGFPGAVREALRRGWNVELWSFTAGLSRAWKETARRERWHELGKFTIWALDDWAEQLVEVGDEEEL
ncbi:hypothetical protein IAT40_006652 [Kwoniella sp. CBS 6097]